jgi:hypothetical protein
MIVHLSQPLALNGGTIDQVTVRVPAESEWDANSEGVDEAIWNLSKATGLPVNVVPRLPAADIDAISTAWIVVMRNWNQALAGECTSHLTFRRRHFRKLPGRR